VPLGSEALLAGLQRLEGMSIPLRLWAAGPDRKLFTSLGEPRPVLSADRRPTTESATGDKANHGEPDEDEDVFGRGGKLRDAWTGHELIRTLLSGARRFDEQAEVDEHFQAIRQIFKVSDSRALDEPTGTLVLWVKGYDVTDEERREGCIGNYMKLIPVRQGDHFIVRVRKRPEPATRHPARNSKKQTHPNWGVRALRTAQGNPDRKRGKPYKSRAEAEADIDWLREEYPEAVSDERQGRYGVLIWDPLRSKGPRPVRQFAIYVKKADDGFVLMAESEERDGSAAGDSQP
jgi:hypothetical protein